MDRRRYLLCSGVAAAILAGCVDQEQNNDREDTTMDAKDNNLVLENRDKEAHSIQVTVSFDGDEIFNHTADLSSSDRRERPLNLDEPGTYTVSATVDENESKTWSVHFGEYFVQDTSKVFVTIDREDLELSWEE